MVLSAYRLCTRGFHVRLDIFGNLENIFKYTLKAVAKLAKFCTQIFSRGCYLLGSNTYAKQMGQKIYNLHIECKSWQFWQN